MICDICGVRDAMVVVQQVSSSGRKEVHLCLQCAAQRGLSTHNGKLEMSLASLFESISNRMKIQRRCPVFFGNVCYKKIPLFLSGFFCCNHNITSIFICQYYFKIFFKLIFIEFILY